MQNFFLEIFLRILYQGSNKNLYINPEIKPIKSVPQFSVSM